jgi:tetratricopeptide (TPR) repeat protein
MTNEQPFIRASLKLLEETFENVQGYYLDKNTSLFETLSTISAAEASIPVGKKCANLAAQVKHVTLYLDVLEKSLRGDDSQQVDWGEIWLTTSEVDEAEWHTIKTDLPLKYEGVLATLNANLDLTNYENLAMIMAIIAHTAYHLGEIRQALCVLKP